MHSISYYIEYHIEFHIILKLLHINLG